MKFIISITISIFTLINTSSFANEAGVNLTLYNNCKAPIYYSVRQSDQYGTKSETILAPGNLETIAPKNSKNLGYYSTTGDDKYFWIGFAFDKKIQTQRNINNVQVVGSVTIWLYIKNLINHMSPRHINGLIQSDCSQGDGQCSWANIVGNTPTYKITACPNGSDQFITVKNLGLGNTYIHNQYNSIIETIQAHNSGNIYYYGQLYQFSFSKSDTKCYLGSQNNQNSSKLYCDHSSIYPYMNASENTLAFMCSQTNRQSSQCPYIISNHNDSNTFSIYQ